VESVPVVLWWERGKALPPGITATATIPPGVTPSRLAAGGTLWTSTIIKGLHTLVRALVVAVGVMIGPRA